MPTVIRFYLSHERSTFVEAHEHYDSRDNEYFAGHMDGGKARYDKSITRDEAADILSKARREML